MAGKKKALTEKAKRFCEEYLIDLNATQAAIRAGYSKKTSGEIGHNLLKKVEIQEHIQKERDKQSKRTHITADKVLKELALLGFSNMLDYVSISDDGDAFVDLSGLDRESAAAVQEITVEDYIDGREENARDVKKVKFKLADKKASLELLGKHLALFKDRIEHSGSLTFEVTPPPLPGDGE